MQSSRSAKFVLIAASLVFLFAGVPNRVLADADKAEVVGWLVQSCANLAEYVDGEALDYSSCSNGQHCTNCQAIVLLITIIADRNVETVASYQPLRRLQVDNQPQFKPPRIS